MKFGIKLLGLIFVLIVLLGLLSYLNTSDSIKKATNKKHEVGKTYEMVLPKEIELTQSISTGSNTVTKKFKFTKDKKTYKGSTVIDIQPGDKVKYQFVDESKNEIKITESQRDIKS